MSFKVLVIPEDPTDNGYILRPLMQAIMADAGKPARVQVLSNPRLNGYDQAVMAIRNDLPDRYRFWDLWLFVPDADRAGTEAMNALERDLAEKEGIRLLCCAADPELEIYACVAYRDEIADGWNVVRKHARLKEEVFAPLLATHGDSRRAGEGRDLMVAESLRNLRGLFHCCPELKRLRDRIEQTVQQI